MGNHGVMARLMTMVTVLALALAPAIIVATHGPAAMAEPAEFAAHGHSHDSDGDPWQSHDAMDHEHQHNAVLTGRAEAHDVPAERLHVLNARVADGRAEDRPKRPPRV